MSTTVKSHIPQFTVPVEKTKTESTAKQRDFWARAEFNRFGIVPMLLIFVVCISGIAAGLGAPGNAFQLSVVAFPTAVALSLVLAVAPMRAIVYSSAIAVFLDLLVMIF